MLYLCKMDRDKIHVRVMDGKVWYYKPKERGEPGHQMFTTEVDFVRGDEGENFYKANVRFECSRRWN